MQEFLTVINKPGHTKSVELLIKEFHSLRKQGQSVITVISSMSAALIKALWTLLRSLWVHVRYWLEEPLRANFMSFTPWLTNCPANRGMYSMMARRTLHFASSASSTIAGSSDCESWRMPITSFTQSRLEMMLRRTSGHYDRKIKMYKWSFLTACKYSNIADNNLSQTDTFLDFWQP